MGRNSQRQQVYFATRLPSSHSLPAQARPGDIDFLVALKLFPCSSLSSQLLLVSEAWKAKAATVWGFTVACLKFSFCNGAGFVFATQSLHGHDAHSLSSHTLQACTHTLALSPLTHLAFCYLFSSNPFCLWRMCVWVFCCCCFMVLFCFWEMFKCILDIQCLTNSYPPTFQNIEYFANEWLKSSPSSGVTLGRWAVSKTNLHCSHN